jgi:hypothetical protein
MTYSTDASSSTSWEVFQDFTDSTSYATESSSQLTVRPLQHRDDTSNMEMGVPFDVLPQDIDELQNISPQTAQFPSGHPSAFDRTAMGIPGATPFSVQPPVTDFVDQMISAFNACVSRMSDQSYPHDQVSEVLKRLGSMTTFFTSKLSSSPASPDEPVGQDRGKFQCLLCDNKEKPKIYAAFGTLKRHFSTEHNIYDFRWRCFECHEIFPRRDRMRDHLRVHRIYNITHAELEQTRLPCPAPDSCPICSDPVVADWDVIFKHIKEDCHGPRPEAASINGDQSRGGDMGGNGWTGNGHGHSQGHGYGSSSAGASRHNGQLPFYPNQSWNQSNNQRGYNRYPDAHFEGSRSRSNARPGSALHSDLDGQLDLGHHQRSNRAIGKLPMNDLPSRSVGSRAHLPGGVNKQPRKLQPPHTPGSSRSGQSSQKRRRSRKQKEPTQQKEPDLRACERCSHIMTRCERCSTVTGCHKCGPAPSRSAIQAGASSGMPVQSYQDPSSVVTTLNPTYLDYGGMIEPFGLMATPFLDYHTDGATQQFGTQPQYQSFESMTNTFVDDSSPGDQYVAMARVAGSHDILRGLSGKIQDSSVVESDIRLLRSIGLGSFIRPSPVKGQIKQLQPEASVVPTPSLYTDLVLRSKGSSRISKAPEPATQCQCACITKPIVKHESRAVFQLSLNEWVDMTFKMSPARGTSHPLRIRVQVVVKFLKLRTAAAQSSTQKQRRRSIESVSKCEDADDTDSDQDLPATSPSGSEITPMSYWTEEVQDCSFNFDIKWAALLNLAQWISDIDADTCQNLLLSDPGRILDLISKYIMCKFEIYWLLMGSNGLGLLMSI